MNFWLLLQILVNLVLFAGLATLWLKLNRPPKDDPRLSKGLQLLQSKISVLEDLSDRTETQVQQLSAMLEGKVKDVQAKILASEKQLAKIEQATQKSMEVAKIFQDRIPHEEIRERQNTKKFVKAARLAHQGASVEEIMRQTGVSQGEAEFIAKVNRDQLQFCEDSLPSWIEDGDMNASMPQQDDGVYIPETQRSIPRDLSAAFEVPNMDKDSLKKLGDAFKAACQEQQVSKVDGIVESKEVKQEGFKDLSELLMQSQGVKTPTQQRVISKDINIRPMEFPKI